MSDKVKVRELWYVNNKKLLNRAIAAATWLPNIGTEPVSHTELWEGENLGWIELKSKGTGDVQIFEKCVSIHNLTGTASDTKGMYEYAGQCWTSTTRKTHPGDKAGTKVRPASQVLDHPENWLFTEHEVEYAKFSLARLRACERVAHNKGYSFRDLPRFIMPLWLLKATRLADNGREICSEHVAQWLVDMGVLGKNTIPSPRRLCKAVVLATGSPLRRPCDDSIVRDGKWRKVK